MAEIVDIDLSLKSYNQIIINILQFNRDRTPHASTQFSLIRHQTARGAIG